MTKLLSFEFFWCECRGLRGEHDLVELFELIRPLGLALADGAWTNSAHPTPIDDIAAGLAVGHWDWPKIWPRAKARPDNPLKHTERWGRGLLRIDQPETFSTVEITRRGLDQFDLLFNITAIGLNKTGLSTEAFAQGWGDLLERLGEQLYPVVRPALAILIACGDTLPDFVRPVLDRRLSVGWRTWFGPAYVERYGLDFLAGLPDRTAPLQDGGIRHEIDRSALDLIFGSDVYQEARGYFEHAGQTAFWPRRRRARELQTQKKSALTAFAEYVVDLLATTIELQGGTRVKMLPLGWDKLREPHRAIAVDRVQQVLADELKSHPSGRVELEIDSLPAPLKKVLDELSSQAEGRLLYRVVPELSPE